MIMRKLLLLFAVVMCTTTIRAAKANPQPVDITQPDGTILTIRVHGDEHFNWCSTVDGVVLAQVGNAYYVADIDREGRVKKTNQLAHNAAQRNHAEQALAARQNKKALFDAAQRAIEAARTRSYEWNTTTFPHTGNPKALVILAEFSDVAFSINSPKQAFDEYLNATGALTDFGNKNNLNYGSVAKYFTDMSFGAFTPQFDVVGPVHLNQPLVYYGEGRSDRMDRLFPDACKAAQAMGVDFSKYDANNDGYVDLLYVIYAGYSASIGGNSIDCIWPKSGNYPTSEVFDGKQIGRYGVNGELNYNPSFSSLKQINGIGLFCHEFSHCMGLPDFYTTTAAPEATQEADNQELEYWDLMDGGEYVANGHRPTAYSAWEREAMDWATIETLNESKNDIELKTLDKGGKAYRIFNPNDASKQEYLLVENVQLEGWNNSPKHKGHGMLVYHVEYDPVSFSLSSNSVNNILGHPRMTLVPADGLLETIAKYLAAPNRKGYYDQLKGDPFPGTSGKTELNRTMNLPNFKWYTGKGSDYTIGQAFKNIKEVGGIITFDFVKDYATGIDHSIHADETNAKGRIYTIDGRYMGTDKARLPRGLYIMNGRKFVIE